MNKAISENPIQSYLEEFGVSGEKFQAYPKDSRVAKAYEVALDVRKFEIELYWKRAGYFWLLLAALATSLGVIATSGTEQVLGAARRETVSLFISCAGTVLSICWAIVNRASKVWQRNWELQVDVLEDKVIGPLYKTVMYKGGKGQYPIHFSISDANFWISIYFVLLFFSCVIYFSGIGRYQDFHLVKCAIVSLNVLFVCWLLAKSRTMQNSGKLEVPLSYSRRKIVPGERIDAATSK